MSFWNYLGLACLFDTIFGKKEYGNISPPHRVCDPDREAKLDKRINDLSYRIDALQEKLDNIDPDSDICNDAELELFRHQDDLDDL